MVFESIGEIALVCVVCAGIFFLLWVLYHFIREGKKKRRSRRRFSASIIHYSSRRKIALVVFLTASSASLMGQSSPVSPNQSSTAAQDSQVGALEDKVELLQRQLEEVKNELVALKEARVGSRAEAVPSPTVVTPPQPDATANTASVAGATPKGVTAAAVSAEKVPSKLPLPPGATLNVTVDGYYDYNFNHPVGRVNSLRAYDVLSNSFNLNQAAVIFELPTDPEAGRRFGARLDLQFGQATATLQGNPANENRPDIYRNIFQAYGRYVAPVGKGLTLDFGKWASSLGYEGNYTKDQLNYSRSFYFYYLPFYHMGLRANYKINDKVAFNYWIDNGTQQSEAFNSFKDQMFGFTVTPKSTISWTLNYYLGQEHQDATPSTNCGSAPLQPGLCFTPVGHPPDGRTHIFDTYLSWQVRPKLLLGVEGDYLIQRLWQSAAPGESSAPSHVDGGAAYAQYQFNPHASFAARTEYLSDRGGLFSGTTQALKEATGTFSYRFGDGFMGMAEYRRDWSNHLFFPRGDAGAFAGHQDTATIGLIWWYGGKQGAW
jgi:hypothetical protein